MEAGPLVGGSLVVLLRGTALANNGNGHGGPARSVIFINGDGMSAAHREAARLALAGFDGDLAMDTLGATGLKTTAPATPRPGSPTRQPPRRPGRPAGKATTAPSAST